MVYKKIKQYMISLITLLIFDFLWLFFIMKGFYSNELSSFARPEILPYWSAAFAWLLIPLGIILFVDKISKNYKESIIYGAIYGLILYGLYDFTNYAILDGWTINFLVVDVLWGIFLCSVNSLLVKYFTEKWLK